MSFTRNKIRTVEPRQAGFGDGPMLIPNRGVKLYDETGRSLGTFSRARDAWAVLDALDGSA